MNPPLKKLYWLLALVALVFLLVGCTSEAGEGTTAATASPTTLKNPGVSTTSVPDPQLTARSFLDAWKSEDYATMYSMLSALTQDSMTQDEFAARYQNAVNSMTMVSFDYELLSTLTNPTSAQVGYQVDYATAMLGDLSSQMVMNLTLEDGAWRVQWEDGMILNELTGGKTLGLEVETPTRGNIYDRDGHALAAYTDAVALGVVPGDINTDTEGTLLAQLSDLTGKTVDAIQSLYEYSSADWYIPVGEATYEEVEKKLDILEALEPGLSMSSYRARYYFDGGVAPHAIGYVQSIFAEELDDYLRQGYQADEMVGKTGIEAWAEEYLRGKSKAALYIYNPQGNPETVLAEAAAEPSQSIYTTIDKDLQLKIQKSMGDYNGAVVVLERDTGRVLAMVSSPSYDPNLFEPSNYNSMSLSELQGDTDNPLWNRATQGLYPLGSVFKIITMAAALESGMYTEDSSFYCDSSWTGGLDTTLYDWTYEKELPPSGELTLPQGLIRSCNPWFWQIGLTMFRNPDHALDVTDMSKAFGLGADTGIEQVAEEAGSIPEPLTDDEAVQQAIGQGTMLVTPIQVARFVAAVGNGGTLYQPNLIEEIAPIDGDPTYTFSPVVQGSLPISEENLKIIQEAMVGVIESTKPLGTAHYTLANVSVPIAGKTGTAQNSTGDAHAWFAGYTDAGRTDLPDIAIAVILENAGEGSEKAAPLFRRIVQLYFSDGQNAGGIMPWESSPYVVSTETPEPDETETPNP